MCNRNFANTIKEILSVRPPKLIRDDELSYRHAGVLIPLFEEDGIHKVLFTKRSDKVENHKGQISFPGGSVDEEDSSVEETALREACEEIGLLRDDVEILGRIDDTLTLVSNFVVHPFVGLVPYPYDFTINEAEVERLIMVPLRLFHPSVPGIKRGFIEFEGKACHTTTYKYDGEVIWGATARIMENFMNVILHKLPLPEGSK